MTAMSAPQDDNDKSVPPKADDFWAQRRRKNLAILGTILGLAVLFFVITILRMS